MSNNLDMREVYTKQLQDRGYATSGFSYGDADIVPLFDTFHELLDEIYDDKGQPSKFGQAILEAFHTTVPGREKNSKGFIERRLIGVTSIYEIGREPATEDKDQMHYTPQTKPHVEAVMGRNMPRLVRGLLDQCEDVYRGMAASMRPVASAMGLEHILFAPEGSIYENIHLVRLLRYPGHTPDQIIALPGPGTKAELHFDRGKFTVAPWDNRPGLVGAPSNNGHVDPHFTIDKFIQTAQQAFDTPIYHRGGEAKVFAGAGYNYLPDHMRDPIPLLLHGVRDPNPALPRNALVGFFNEHSGVPNIGSPEPHQTGYGSVYKFLQERNLALFA